MEFVFVETEIEAAGLRNPMLEILQPDTNPYHAILYQHNGVLNAQPIHFGNENQELAVNQFLGTISLVVNSNVTLFVSPEYSCPWDVIRAILEDSKRQPRGGAVWALGCESICPKALRQFKNDFEENKGVKIIFDETVLNKSGNFLDPLCYVFKTTTNVGNDVIVCLVQFKTQHMGVWSDPIERDHYIPGRKLYVFRNAVDSIYLFTLICSEAIVFENSEASLRKIDPRWSIAPYIILNPQLNPEANHSDFRQFRRKILQNEKKEIITLNWTLGSSIKVGNAATRLDRFPGSGIYTDADGINFAKDDNFLQNHHRGLYYTFRKPKYHIYYLNGLKEIFYLQNLKPFQGNGALPLNQRSGPSMIDCYDLAADCSTPSATQIDDGLISFLDLSGSQNNVLRGTTLDSLGKERLITLSSGEIDPKDDRHWFRVNRMRVCTVDEDGVICRLTFAQDRQGNRIRRELVDNLDRLNRIILDPDYLPQTLSFLNGNFTEVMFFRDEKGFHYNFNLVSTDNQNKATGAFCGRADAAEAKKRFDKILKLFSDSDQQRTRVVVWYESSVGTIQSIVPPKATIRDDYSTDARSISKGI